MKPEYVVSFKTFINPNGNNPLESKTQQYWRIKRCWNGIDVDKKMTVSKALTIIHDIRKELNPERPLNAGLESLRDQIVEHGSNSKSKPQLTTQPRIVLL